MWGDVERISWSRAYLPWNLGAHLALEAEGAVPSCGDPTLHYLVITYSVLNPHEALVLVVATIHDTTFSRPLPNHPTAQ